MVSWLDVVGRSPKAQVIDVLLHAERDISPGEIHRRAPNVQPGAVVAALEELEAFELVEQTRTVGDTLLFEIDRSARVMSDIRKVRRSTNKYLEEPDDES